ncbi:hypothetical protein BD410DRAFT_789451 [Rickenella mellea]|uniref:CRAL-TRIO domain-containing protein n=1 Tax=Rickenella mellea TaxID=50990 RepID=A0A4Y7Q233_9AGAM|nr:hypothetical protein BD410DRAFT_789451 [Rickenella mellea]
MTSRAPLTLQCMPSHIRDSLGHPIAVLRLDEANFEADVIKADIISFLERMRALLRDASTGASSQEVENQNVVLQFVLLVDVDNIPVKVLPIDLISWYIREVQPRFHGMIAAAFVVNHSWTHSGFWSVIKHLLPSSAVSRLIFLSPEEASQILPSSVLTRQLVNNHPRRPISQVVEARPPALPPSPPPTPPAVPLISKIASVSRFSVLNPFFGYPINPPPAESSLERSVPQLRHGRRRKRDLLRALAILFWQKWKTCMSVGSFMMVTYFVIRFYVRDVRRRRMLLAL